MTQTYQDVEISNNINILINKTQRIYALFQWHFFVLVRFLLIPFGDCYHGGSSNISFGMHVKQLLKRLI